MVEGCRFLAFLVFVFVNGLVVDGQRQLCPTNWVRFDEFREIPIADTCFHPSATKASFKEAREFCRENIGYLVDVDKVTKFINNGQKGYNLAEYLYEVHNITRFWTGMLVKDSRLVAETFGYRYITKTRFGDQNTTWDWDVDQPSVASGTCGTLRNVLQNITGGINNETLVTISTGRVLASLQDCSKEEFFVCQRAPVSLEVKTTSFCPPGWVGNVHLSYCFRIVIQSETFTSAQRKCVENGGRLAPATDSFDNQFIAIVYQFYMTNNAFFGRNQLPVWVGTQATNKSCLYIQGSNSSLISTTPCNNSYSYMCVRDTVFPEPGRFEVVSPYQSQAELEQYIPFQPLPLGFRMERFPTEMELPFIRTPTNVLNMTTLSIKIMAFDYQPSISSITASPFYFNITVPKLQQENPFKRSISDKYAQYETSFTEDTKQRAKRQVENNPILPPEQFIDYDLILNYIGYYSGLLYSTNPPMVVETEPLLLRFSESSLFIYVAYVDVWPGATPLGESPTIATRFNLLQDGLEPGILREAGAEPFYSPNILYSRSLVERIDGLTVRYRVFIVPRYTETTVTPLVFEQKMLRELTTFRQQMLYFSALFRTFVPESVVVRSTVSCSPRTLLDPNTGKNVTFRLTRAGQTGYTVERCASGAGAVARSMCRGGYLEGAFWGPAQFRENCTSVDIEDLPKSDSSTHLRNLSEIYVNQNNSLDVLNDIRELTSPESVDLTTVDVIYVSVIFENYRDLDPIVPELVELATDILDNVLNIDSDVVESAQDIIGSSNTIIQSFDDIVNQIEPPIPDGFDVVRSTIAVFVRDQDGTEEELFIGFKTQGARATQLTNGNVARVQLPTDVIDGMVISDKDAAIFLPVELLRGSKSRISFQIYAETRLFSTPYGRYQLNSKVVAARLTLNGKPVTDLGSSRVTAVFLPSEPSENIVCGYWNYTGNENAGDWATEGCEKSTNGDHVICSCDHLTNFAILVDLEAHTISDLDKTILGIITMVGLIISIIALGFTLLTFIVFKSGPAGILISLSFAMLCTAIIFLVGIERTENIAGCKAVAALLHYFILASFMWMLIEGILQYMRFVKVLGTYVPRFMLKASIPAWGLPLIPVIIVLAIDTDLYYGGNGYCWLGYDAMLYAFLIPVAVVILVNIIVFSMIVYKLCCGRKSIQVNQSERKMRFLYFQAALSVFFVLGLTWIFGFFALEGAQIVFHYLFSILNAFQGFIIFMLFTAREKKIRQAWEKLCCKKRYREKKSSSGTGTDPYVRKGVNSASHTSSNSTAFTDSSSSNGEDFHDLSRQPMNFRNPEYDDNNGRC